MRHRKAKITLDRSAAARKSLLRNLATSVILYERVRTTSAKARAVRPLVERVLHLGKTGSLTNRRALGAVLMTDGAIKKVIEVLGPRYQSRSGGCVRITKLGMRQGDRAELVALELV